MIFSKYKKIFMYSMLTLIAFTIRSYVMDGKESWHDEWHSIYVSNPNIEFNQTMDRYWGNKGDSFLTEYYPPLYLILLKYFFLFLGYSDVIGRGFSLLFGILIIPLSLYVFENISKTNKNNYYFGFAIAFNLFLIWQSLEIRAHSLSTFLSLLSIAIFLKIKKTNHIMLHISYLIISIINLSIWPITLTIYFGKLVYLIKEFFLKKKNKEIITIIINIFLVIILYAIINYKYLFYNVNRTEHYTLLNINFFLNYHFRSFFGSIFLGGVFLVIFTYFLIKKRKEIIFKNNHSNLIIYIILSTYLLTLLYSIIRAPIMSPKYVMYILPLIIIWVYDNIQNKKIYILLTLLLIGLPLFNLKNFPIKSPPTAEALNIVINNNGKYIFSSDNDVFKNYIRTKKDFINNKLILLDDLKNLKNLNIEEIWFICLNNPSFAYGDSKLPDEKKCTQNLMPPDYKINKIIYIKDFLIKSYVKT